MKAIKMWSAAIVLSLAVTGTSHADTYSGRAAAESGQAASHAGGSMVNGAAASGQATSAAVAVPFAIVGSVGMVSGEIANGLMDAATAPAEGPLPVSSEAVTAGTPPDQALKTGNR
jgi:hypothetical protein